MQSDAELDAYIRATLHAGMHPTSSCAMGSGEMAVVDASVMLYIVSGNTNGPTFLIAEKASDERLLAIECRVRLEAVCDLTPEVPKVHGFERLLPLPAGQVIEVPQFINFHMDERGKFVKALCALYEGAPAAGAGSRKLR